MPTVNTFSTPTAGKSFTLSLNDFNNSLLSLFNNFYGPVPPSSSEITVAGVSTNPYAGMLYRSSIYNAFYAYDPTAKKGGGISSNYTRVGLGSRNFESITDLVANIAVIEQTELLTTVGSGANYRLYMKTSNTPSIVDVGIPPTSSLISSMFVARQVPNTAIAVNSITRHELAPLTITAAELTNTTITGAKIASATITGDKLSANLSYTSNLNMSGNVVFAANKGLRFADGSRQNSAAMINFANVGSGASFVYNKSANGNLVMKTATTSLSLTGDSLGTGNFVINDSGGTLTFALTLGTGVGVSVGVGVGVGIAK